MPRRLAFCVLIPVRGFLKAPSVQRGFQLRRLQKQGEHRLFSDDSTFVDNFLLLEGMKQVSSCSAKRHYAITISAIIMPDDVAEEKVKALLALGANVERVRPASIVDKKQVISD